MDTHKELWTAADLARAKGMTRQRIYQLLHAGAIQAEQFNGVWIIRREEALRFVAEHQKYKKTKEEAQTEIA